MDHCAALVYYGYQYICISPFLPDTHQKNSIRYLNNHCKFLKLSTPFEVTDDSNAWLLVFHSKSKLCMNTFQLIMQYSVPCIFAVFNHLVKLNMHLILSNVSYYFSSGSTMDQFSVIEAGTSFLLSFHFSSCLFWVFSSFLLLLPCSLNCFIEKQVICTSTPPSPPPPPPTPPSLHGMHNNRLIVFLQLINTTWFFSMHLSICCCIKGLTVILLNLGTSFFCKARTFLCGSN